MSTVLMVLQISMCLPYCRLSLTDWLHEPANPIRFFSLLWFSIYAFLAVPAAVAIGGRLGRGAHA